MAWLLIILSPLLKFISGEKSIFTFKKSHILCLDESFVSTVKSSNQAIFIIALSEVVCRDDMLF
jgi:hypothetical protein